jgi:hypothetical protein
VPSKRSGSPLAVARRKRGGGAVNKRVGGLRAAVLAMCAVTLACCSGHTTPSTVISTPTTTAAGTSSTVAAHASVYRMGTVAVSAAFSGTPVAESEPPTLAALLPPHSTVTAWSVGNLGAFVVHSYELVLATFPPGSTLATIDTFLRSYAGTPNTTRYGRPALRKLTPIPLSTGTRYSGITAFSVGRALVIAVGYDDVQATVAAFLASVRLVSSP